MGHRNLIIPGSGLEMLFINAYQVFVDKTGKIAKCVSNPNFYAHKLNTKFPQVEQFNTLKEHPPRLLLFLYHTEPQGDTECPRISA